MEKDLRAGWKLPWCRARRTGRKEEESLGTDILEDVEAKIEWWARCNSRKRGVVVQAPWPRA